MDHWTPVIVDVEFPWDWELNRPHRTELEQPQISDQRPFLEGQNPNDHVRFWKEDCLPALPRIGDEFRFRVARQMENDPSWIEFKVTRVIWLDWRKRFVIGLWSHDTILPQDFSLEEWKPGEYDLKLP